MEQQNTQVLREAYKKWHDEKASKAAADHWLGIMADKIDFRSVGVALPGVPLSQAGTSKADVGVYLGTLRRDWEMLYYNVEDYVAQGDRVTAITNVSFRHRGTGKVVTTPKADVWRFDTDGKAVAFFEYYDTAALVAAATLSPEERNAKTLSDSYSLWQRCKDCPEEFGPAVERWLSLFADTFVFTTAGHEIGALKFNRRRTHKSELPSYFEEIARDWQMVDYTVDDLMAKDNHVIAICNCTWRCIHNDTVVSAIKVDSWRFNDDGKVIEFNEHFDTAPAIAALTNATVKS